MIRSEVVIRFEQLYDSIRSIMDLEAREERNIYRIEDSVFWITSAIYLFLSLSLLVNGFAIFGIVADSGGAIGFLSEICCKRFVVTMAENKI